MVAGTPASRQLSLAPLFVSLRRKKRAAAVVVAFTSPAKYIAWYDQIWNSAGNCETSSLKSASAPLADGSACRLPAKI